MIQLDIQVPHLRGLLEIGGQEQRDVAEQAAIGVRNLVRKHFSGLGGESFWNEAASHTRVEEEGDGYAVTVRHRGVALQRYGGVVLPGKTKSTYTGEPTKLLAIPAEKSVEEAPNAYGILAFVPVKGGGLLRGLLIPGEVGIAKHKYKDKPAGRRIVRPQKDAEPYFHLVTKTVHQPNPAVLPTDAELAAAAADYAADELQDILSRKR